MEKEIKKEAIVLDKTTREIQFKQTPVLQCLSTLNFALLEIQTDMSVNIQERINTNNLSIRRIPYERLTNMAKNELERSVEILVEENSDKYVSFFNNARPIGIRRHQLDLLPMIGKKHKTAILEYLEKNGPFEKLTDLKNIEMLPDPIKIITFRIIEEIKNEKDEKIFLFTTPFTRRN